MFVLHAILVTSLVCVRARLQRDVPGFSRGAIPVLSAAGVRAVSIGVNEASAPPGVPKNTPFIWSDQRTGTSLIGMLHPGALLSKL